MLSPRCAATTARAARTRNPSPAPAPLPQPRGPTPTSAPAPALARLLLAGASCLSYAGAVAPGLYANRTGFTLDDVAADCLHPDQGRYGNAYASEILRHWLWQAARRVRSGVRSARRARSAPPTAGMAEAWSLPPPCNATEPAALQGPERVLRLQAEADGRSPVRVRVREG